MAEEKKKNQMSQSNVCTCGCGCGMNGGWAVRLIRWILGIVILIIVFSLGMKLGELKSELEYHVADHLMGGGYGRMQMMQGGGEGMMPGASSTMPGNAEY